MARPEKWKDEFVHLAAKACELGATDRDIADLLKVSERTISYWRISRPEFAGVLKVGKEKSDARVERSLFHRAVGYTFESEKVFQYQGEIVRAAIIEHVPPDTTAGIFWLKNRRPDLWRDKQDVEHELGDKLLDLIRESMEPGKG